MATNQTPTDKAKTDKTAPQQRKNRKGYKRLTLEEYSQLQQLAQDYSRMQLKVTTSEKKQAGLQSQLESAYKVSESWRQRFFDLKNQVNSDRYQLRKDYKKLQEEYEELKQRERTHELLAAFGVWCEKHRKLLWRYIQYLWKRHEKEFIKQNNNQNKNQDYDTTGE